MSQFPQWMIAFVWVERDGRTFPPTDSHWFASTVTCSLTHLAVTWCPNICPTDQITYAGWYSRKVRCPSLLLSCPGRRSEQSLGKLVFQPMDRTQCRQPCVDCLHNGSSSSSHVLVTTPWFLFFSSILKIENLKKKKKMTSYFFFLFLWP